MRNARRLLLLSAAAIWIIGVLGWAVFARVRNGPPRNCILDFGIALPYYAIDHDGRFPDGGSSSEANLAQLAIPRYDVGPELLCGKSVPLEVTKWALSGNNRLGPDSCGWRYQAGLTLRDDPKLAIIWDNIGNDYALECCCRYGGRQVLTLGGNLLWIPAERWTAFLQNQEVLLSQRTSQAKKGIPLATAKVRSPSGEILSKYDGSWTVTECIEGGVGSASNVYAGGGSLSLVTLNFYGYCLGKARLSLRLQLGQWTSDQVMVDVDGASDKPVEVIFNMK